MFLKRHPGAGKLLNAMLGTISHLSGFIVAVAVLRHRVSLDSSGYSRVHSVDQAGLELTETHLQPPPASPKCWDSTRATMPITCF